MLDYLPYSTLRDLSARALITLYVARETIGATLCPRQIYAKYKEHFKKTHTQNKGVQYFTYSAVCCLWSRTVMYTIHVV